MIEYRYLCTKGHHVVASEPDLRTCPAILPWPMRAESAPCGAQLSPFKGEAYEAIEDELEVAQAENARLVSALKNIRTLALSGAGPYDIMRIREILTAALSECASKDPQR